jgi:hypothetical protein
MDLPGEAYLYNLSLLAISFSVVSALITLLRQTLGGKLTVFDVYIIKVYVGQGFVIAVAAILPSLISHFGLPLQMVLTIASLCAAILLGAHEIWQLMERKVTAPGRMPTATAFSFVLDGLAILLLLANGLIWTIQQIALLEFALTLSLATIMWIFLRRIATLVGQTSTEDFTPSRG